MKKQFASALAAGFLVSLALPGAAQSVSTDRVAAAGVSTVVVEADGYDVSLEPGTGDEVLVRWLGAAKGAPPPLRWPPPRRPRTGSVGGRGRPHGRRRPRCVGNATEAGSR